MDGLMPGLKTRPTGLECPVRARLGSVVSQVSNARPGAPARGQTGVQFVNRPRLIASRLLTGRPLKVRVGSIRMAESERRCGAVVRAGFCGVANANASIRR